MTTTTTESLYCTVEPRCLEVSRNRKKNSKYQNFLVIEAIKNVHTYTGTEKKIPRTETSRYRSSKYRGSTVITNM